MPQLGRGAVTSAHAAAEPRQRDRPLLRSAAACAEMRPPPPSQGRELLTTRRRLPANVAIVEHRAGCDRGGRGHRLLAAAGARAQPPERARHVHVRAVSQRHLAAARRDDAQPPRARPALMAARGAELLHADLGSARLARHGRAHKLDGGRPEESRDRAGEKANVSRPLSEPERTHAGEQKAMRARAVSRRAAASLAGLDEGLRAPRRRRATTAAPREVRG